jgi:hypothetical protein
MTLDMDGGVCKGTEGRDGLQNFIFFSVRHIIT